MVNWVLLIYFGFVVVIECRGRYCFLYIELLLGLEIFLSIICIDMLLYILVVDNKINII